MGALLNWVTPSYARVLRQQFVQAAVEAGCSPDDLLPAGYVRVEVGTDAADAMSKQIGFYPRLPFYREHWEAMGNPAGDEVAVISSHGEGLQEQLAAWDALDVIVARIVPMTPHNVVRTVEALLRPA